MKLSTAVSLVCASWLVLADAAAIPPSVRESTLDVTTLGAGHHITRAERVIQYKRGRHDDDDGDNKHGNWGHGKKHGSDDDDSGDSGEDSGPDDSGEDSGSGDSDEDSGSGDSGSGDSDEDSGSGDTGEGSGSGDSGEDSSSGDSGDSSEDSGSSDNSGDDSGSGTSADGKTYTGTGTFFTPSTEGGSTGACGDFNEDDAEIVALNGEQYGDSSSKSDWCGKKVEITVDGKSATATITDMCPECKTGDLDMTKAVFQQLGDLETGELDISWKVVS